MLAVLQLAPQVCILSLQVPAQLLRLGQEAFQLSSLPSIQARSGLYCRHPTETQTHAVVSGEVWGVAGVSHPGLCLAGAGERSLEVGHEADDLVAPHQLLLRERLQRSI